MLSDDEKLKLFFSTLQTVNFRDVNIEAWYQELKGNSNRSIGEEIVFQTMDFNRSMDYNRSLENAHSKEFDAKLNSFGISRRTVHLMYFDWDSRPITNWEYLFKYCFFPRHVGESEVDKYRISTVWLGMNPSFHGHLPPLIFETMIFNTREDDQEGEDDEINLFQKRYSTFKEALDGHQNAVELCHSKRLRLDPTKLFSYKRNSSQS